MPHYVYSTLSCDNVYNMYARTTSGNKAVVKRGILIKGGTGIATKHLVTPIGVCTEVSDDDMEYLKTDEVFKTHVDNGFIKFEKKKYDAEKVAGDMELGDGSEPITPQDSPDPLVSVMNNDDSDDDRKSKKNKLGTLKNELK